jgi:hypothetical protein
LTIGASHVLPPSLPPFLLPSFPSSLPQDATVDEEEVYDEEEDGMLA